MQPVRLEVQFKPLLPNLQRDHAHHDCEDETDQKLEHGGTIGTNDTRTTNDASVPELLIRGERFTGKLELHADLDNIRTAQDIGVQFLDRSNR